MTVDLPLDVQMIEDEAMGLGQWLTEHPAELREHLSEWDSDAVIRQFSDTLGETALGLSLAHLSAGQTRVVMDVMVQAMWLAHTAIRRAKREQEGSE